MTSLEIKEILQKKDFIEFSQELNEKNTKDEFHKKMTSNNSDIPIETVKFRNHPSVNMET